MIAPARRPAIRGNASRPHARLNAHRIALVRPRPARLAPLLLGLPLAAQAQFAESAKTYVPHHRDANQMVRAADFDGDGDRDLLHGTNHIIGGEQLRLLHNDGTGTFTDVTATHLPVASLFTNGLAIGDVEGDGDLDFVTGDSYQNRLFLNDGSGHFTDATAGRVPATLPYHWNGVFGDGDGDVDLVFGNWLQQSRLLLNNGSAVFTEVTSTHLPAAVLATTALALGDIDGDGDRDLLLGNFGEQTRLYLNNGSGVFQDVTAARLPAVVRDTRALAVGDLDGDGDLDIAVGNDALGLGRLDRLYRNKGSGVFTDEDLIYDYYRTFALKFGDMDDDGDLDAVCGNYDHYDNLCLNNGQGRFGDASWPRMPLSHRRTRSLAIGDVDVDGDLDILRGSDWEHPTLLMNHHRQVWSPRLPKIGAQWTLEVFAKHGYATAPQSALPFLAAAPASIALLPWGRLGLDPLSLVSLPLLALPAPVGKASLSLLIPNAVPLVGATFYAQALVLHTASLADARFTNVLAEKIVR